MSTQEKNHHLLYGKSGLSVSLPENCNANIIRKRTMPIVENPQQTIEAALENAVASPSFKKAVHGKRTACILICDITRPVPNGLFLPIMIRHLQAAGFVKENITVLIATGLHRPNEDEEMRELVGDPWVLDNATVVNHFAEDDAAHVLVGHTEKGTVVRLDRRFVEADVKVATGLVEPHFMAGYSGGRKVIAPGVAHAETITTFHNATFMSHPKATNCVLEGNPLHEEQLEIVQMLGGALALNTVIDENRNLAFVNFGEIVQSHLEAVDFIRSYAEVGVSKRFSTVITSSAGYPLDKTYYQTVKGMVGPLGILAPGGDLIIVSECSEGLGSAHFRDAQRRLVHLGMDGFMESIEQKNHADIDEWQTQMQLKPMRLGNVYLYSDKLSAVDKSLTGVTCIDSVDAVVTESIKRQRSGDVAIIPEGPYVVPFFKERKEKLTTLG